MPDLPQENVGFQHSKETTERLMKLAGEVVVVEITRHSVSALIEGKLSYLGDQKWHVESIFDASANFSIEDVSVIGRQLRITYQSNFIGIVPQ